MSDIGENELSMRMVDIAEVKAGRMTLEEATKRCRKRQRESSLTASMFYHELTLATGRSRKNDLNAPLVFPDGSSGT